MILVTGASGNVGSALVAQLRAADVRFRAAYHSPVKAQRAASDGIDAVTLEMSDSDNVRAALCGVSKVFLLGAMSPAQTANETNVVEAAVSTGVEHVVKQSLWRADEELTPIARLHRPVERLLETSPMSWTFLRANFYLQAFSTNWAGTIRSGNFFASPLIRGPIAFVDAEDIARVAFRALTEDGHAGKAYALTGPAAVSYDEAAAVLSELLGRSIAYRGLSNGEALSALTGAGMPAFHAEALVEVCNVYRDGGAEKVTPTVEEVTGRRPRSFREFAAAHRGLFE
ncbi:SDR family oxidoreductase [Amycolatopsis benzoatilytica]|uniref:SDR family oxidoreductase n=1 Tax=Amycolatopsis benzoatilytica TaxID=346045 RepID=UPI00037D339C|nr:SDR family oxidoreductase [Amycolatopsis benzoatilytica]